MSDLDGKTKYRVTVGLEEVEVVNGIEQTPESVSSIDVKDMEYDNYDDAKAAQVKLSGHKMEDIPDYED